MEQLKPWIFPQTLPAFNDLESATSLEAVHKLYTTMNNLITEYNQFSNNVNTIINDFIECENKDYETFKVAIRQEFQDFIDVVDLSIINQNNLIDGMKKDLTELSNIIINGVIVETALPKTNVNAGTYGGLDTNEGTYSIPNVEVDQYGRIIGISNSLLPYASNEQSGYLHYTDYEKLQHIANKKITELTLSAGRTESYNFYTCTLQQDVLPPVCYLVGEYTDSNGVTWQIPVDWFMRVSDYTDSMTGIVYKVYGVKAKINNSLEYDLKVTIYSNYNLHESM